MKYAVAIIAAFVRNAHLKRVLSIVEPDPQLNFWRVIHGNSFDMAVIDWCKLFGSDHEDRQPVHWKNQMPNEKHDEFRKGLLAAVGLSSEGWLDYRNTVKGYRDNQAAHFNEKYLQPENEPTFPDMTFAIEASYFYYESLLNIMDTQGIAYRYPRDIRAYCMRFADQATYVARGAFAATAHIEEKVF